VRRRAAFEIVALAAARLGSIPLAAQSVIMTTDQSTCRFVSLSLKNINLLLVLNTIPFGIGRHLHVGCARQLIGFARYRRIHTRRKRHWQPRRLRRQIYRSPLGAPKRPNRYTRNALPARFQRRAPSHLKLPLPHLTPPSCRSSDTSSATTSK
jgi:hypothetical protein